MDDNTYDFDLAKAPQTIIKVIGVGGGGGNAVSNMYREGIRDVSFVIHIAIPIIRRCRSRRFLINC